LRGYYSNQSVKGTKELLAPFGQRRVNISRGLGFGTM
jgi:hypothetical protein